MRISEAIGLQVQEWLGHADPAFTLRTYVHLLDDGRGNADFFDQVTGRLTTSRQRGTLDSTVRPWAMGGQ
jgi:hypothetical protein